MKCDCSCGHHQGRKLSDESSAMLYVLIFAVFMIILFVIIYYHNEATYNNPEWRANNNLPTTYIPSGGQ